MKSMTLASPLKSSSCDISYLVLTVIEIRSNVIRAAFSPAARTCGGVSSCQACAGADAGGQNLSPARWLRTGRPIPCRPYRVPAQMLLYVAVPLPTVRAAPR